MKRILLAFILLFVVSGFRLSGQINNPDLCRPDVIRYANKLYVFGYVEKEGELLFQVQRFSAELKKEIEKTVSLGKKTCKDLYSIHSDTLHNYLNFVVQEANNDKTCKIFRFDKNLKPIAEITDAEVARVNTFTAHEKEFYYYKNELFVVRPLSKDSAHKFILQKYSVKDSSKVFEYVAGWQLNFAKQNYHRCKIIRVDEQFVYMYTNVLSGTKKGQWIQYVSKAGGEIVYSIKLNTDENNTYLYAANYVDPDTKQLYVTGYKIANKGVAEDYSRVDYPSGKIKPIPVFVCAVDSVGELSLLTENCILPPQDIEREKEFKQYIFKIEKFRVQNGNYYFLCDVTGSLNGTLYKTYGYALCSIESDIESGKMKPKPAMFNCTYRDSKIKEAKFVFNVHNVDVNNNAEEILYEPAVTSAFKVFNWEPSFLTSKAQGVSVFKNNVDFVMFKYILEENKWKNTEIKREAVPPFFKVFSFDMEKIIYFKALATDAETKIIKGIEGSIIK